MKILYLAGADLSLRHGQAAHIRRLTEAFEHRGHVVRLLTHRPGSPIEWAGPSGGLVDCAGLRAPKLQHLTRERALARAAQQELSSFAPDVWLVRQELYTFAPLLVRRGTVPLLVESNALLSGMSEASGAAPRRVAAVRSFEARLLRAADAVGAVTERLAELLCRDYDLPADRVHVVPNGAWLPPLLGPAAREIRRRRGIGDGEFVLGFAGNLNHVQDLAAVLEAMALLPDLPLRLWIAGDGPARGGLERYAPALGIGSRVEFLGGLTEEEAARHAQAAHLLLAPYRTGIHDALGLESLKVLQALACDRPCLASRATGLGYLEGIAPARSGEAAQVPAGELIDTGEPKHWAAAIRRWWALWRDAGRPGLDWPWPEGEGPGRRFIARRRTWDHCAAAWEAVFASVS